MSVSVSVSVSTYMRSLSALLCAASLLPAVHAGAAAAAGAADPIRIGMIEGMSGPFANAGAAVQRNLQLAIERVNARGGVKLPDGRHPLQLTIFDNKQGVED